MNLRLLWLTVAAILIIFAGKCAHADYKIAVIDTGINQHLTDAPICNAARNDLHPLFHGTNVADLIYRNAGDGGYCIISFRAFDPNFNPAEYTNALITLARIKPDIINLSLAGTVYSSYEASLIKKLLDQGIIIFAAAGNVHHDLDKACDIYPACDDPRIVIVGTYDNNSSYGSRVRIKTRRSTHCIGGKCLIGTSQATAAETGRFIRFLKEHE